MSAINFQCLLVVIHTPLQIIVYSYIKPGNYRYSDESFILQRIPVYTIFTICVAENTRNSEQFSVL